MEKCQVWTNTRKKSENEIINRGGGGAYHS